MDIISKKQNIMFAENYYMCDETGTWKLYFEFLRVFNFSCN